MRIISIEKGYRQTVSPQNNKLNRINRLVCRQGGYFFLFLATMTSVMICITTELNDNRSCSVMYMGPHPLTEGKI